MNINIFVVLLFFTFSINKKITNSYIISKFPSYDKPLTINTNEIKTYNSNLYFDSIEVTILKSEFILLFCIDFFSFFSPNIKSSYSTSETENIEINGKKLI